MNIPSYELRCMYTCFYCPLNSNVFIILFVWSERREDGIIAKRKEWEKCNFALVGKKSGCIDFSTYAHHFFSLQFRERGEQMTLKREVQIYLRLFHSSTFNNKCIITIYFFYFHFSILLPTKHIYDEKHIFYLSNFSFSQPNK